MSTASDVVNDFAVSVGLDQLQLTPGNSLQLAFEHRGMVCLEETEHGLSVCLVRAIDTREGALPLYREALSCCHYRRGLPWTVRAGLRGDSVLVFAIEIESTELNLPVLERAIDLLTGLHDSVIG